MPLRDLDSARAVYTIPEDDLLSEALVPGLAASTSVQCMVGFFDSAALKHVAAGLTAFLNSNRSARLEFIASPVISAEDRAAIQSAHESREDVIQRAALDLLEGSRLCEHALARHAHRCLAYLLAAGRLDLRFALLKTGLFHPKVWILEDGSDTVVIQGSSNFTSPGLLYNYEAVSIERPWRSSDSAEKVARFQAVFRKLWNRTDPNAIVLEASEALKQRLLVEGQNSPPPTMADYDRARGLDVDAGYELSSSQRPELTEDHKPPRLRLPRELNIETGSFSHQGTAVRAWEAAGRRGVLAMATGSGKTISALAAATRLQDEASPLLVVVAVPYRPLVSQWAAAVEQFGIQPILLRGRSKEEREASWRTALDSLRLNVLPIAVVVVTHDYLVSEEFGGITKRIPPEVGTMLVADEVHNLGRPRFLKRPPACFQRRLGLSATPERQYDPEGTKALFDYFGPKCFEFGLAQAIGTCLVPYDYTIVKVTLTAAELDEWDRLTEELRRAGFGQAGADAEDGGRMPSRIVKLLVRRRAIVEGAENKMDALAEALSDQGCGNLRHTLIYATDKRPEQLRAVNAMLAERGVLFHQITQEETGKKTQMADIMERFAAGDIQVLTAKRVLDEGVDIPETQTAYLLASSTVRRQWIQRRGRVLRTCNRIGKKKARIVDFLALPPGDALGTSRGLLIQELTRAQEFAKLAGNAGDEGGALDIIQGLMPN